MTITKTTHSERIRIALEMRAACAAACEERAPAKEAEGYRASNDHWRAAANVVRQVDPVALVNKSEAAPTQSAQQAFEAVAKSQFFNCQKRDNGEYFHPITGRAWAIWQAAIKFKEDSAE